MIQIIKSRKQKTLAEEVVIQGINPLRPFQTVTLKIKPSTGYIKFHLNKDAVPVNYFQKMEGEHTTIIKNGKLSVKSVEHFLSSTVGAGIDSCEVYLKGGDCLPFFDASAENYYKALHKAGIKKTKKDCQTAIVTETIFFSDGKGSLAILQPDDHFSISALIQFPEPIGEQYYSFDPKKESYIKIARSRSFIRASCDDRYWRKSRKKIPILPKKVDDSPILVFKNGCWVVPPRVHLECVKHKILDAIGDLALLGFPIQAKITLIRPGHVFNRSLVSYLGSIISRKL